MKKQFFLCCVGHTSKHFSSVVLAVTGYQQAMGKRGVRQRLDAEAAESIRGSHLAVLLVRLWAWGWMSPQTAQKIAYAAKRDMQASRFLNTQRSF